MAKQNTTPESTEPSTISTMPDIGPRPTVNVVTALGLPESPHESISSSISKMRKDFKLDGTASITPKEETVLEPKAASKKVEKPTAKVDKPTTKSEKGSAKPKLVSEKPIDLEEVTETEAEKEDDTVESAAKSTPPVTAPKVVESEEYKALKKENEEIKKKVDDLISSNNKLSPAPAAAPAPAPEAPKEKTPEEVKAQEDNWVNEVSKFLDAPLTEADHEAILDGGAKAVEKVVAMRKRDMATAILKARTSIYSELSPVFDKMMQDIQRFAPVYDDHIRLQTHRVEQSFTNSYPQIKPHLQTARAVAKALYEKFPDVMSKMSEEDTFKEVYSQTTALLKSLGVEVKIDAPVTTAVTPPVAPVTAPVIPVTAPVAPPAAVTPAAVPAESPRPKPPGSTAPGAQFQGGTTSKEKHKQIADSLTY